LKFVLIALIIVVGIFALFVTIGISPLERNLSEAANTSAVEVLGSNYSQFSGMPELLAYWWILPIFVIVILIGYGIYKAYKG
jgi:hypothetical protein